MNASPSILGIDLGTTFSAAAFVNENGLVEVIRNESDATSTPSVVYLDGDKVEVGETAMNRWKVDHEHVIRWVKLAIGNDSFRFQGRSSVEISAEILKSLKLDAERKFGTRVREAVITCPAYFNSREVENTKSAGEHAGFDVLEVVREPVAAAIYYGVDHMKEGETILVCDLGGGTYDATVLRLENGIFSPLATMGDRELGGHHWTLRLLDLAADRFKAKHGEDPRNDLAAYQALYEACERAKRNFSKTAEEWLPCHHRDIIDQIRVTIDEFESQTAELFDRVVSWSESAVEKAGLTWPQISTVLLVGGSSRLRGLGSRLAACSGRPPKQVQDPDLIVAFGAAVIARGAVRSRRTGGPLSELPVTRETGMIDLSDRIKRTIPRNLGTRTYSARANGFTNQLIIPHGTESPVAKTEEAFEISRHSQPFFDVPIVEFEDDSFYDVIGNFRFTCPAGARRGQRVAVTYDYDKSGIVRVSAILAGKPLPGTREPYVESAPPAVQQRQLVFAVDKSYSMGTDGLAAAVNALLGNSQALLQSSAVQIGVVTFGTTASTLCQLTSDFSVIQNAVSGLEPDGSTAMNEGIDHAANMLAGTGPGGARDLILLTDGMPDDKSLTIAAASRVRAKGIVVSALNINAGIDREFLQQICDTWLDTVQGSDLGQAVHSLLTKAEQTREVRVTER